MAELCRVLEVGAGPGLTTDVLRRHVPRLTAVEVDGRWAERLGDRLAGTNVEVIQADGTRLSFKSGALQTVTTFTMLHHVPSQALQDRLLAELCRVLRPGGLLVGTDSTETPSRRELHAGDTYLPVDPAGLEDRLMAAGFVDPSVEVAEDRFRFSATAPTGARRPSGERRGRGGQPAPIGAPPIQSFLYTR